MSQPQLFPELRTPKMLSSGQSPSHILKMRFFLQRRDNEACSPCFSAGVTVLNEPPDSKEGNGGDSYREAEGSCLLVVCDPSCLCFDVCVHDAKTGPDRVSFYYGLI